MVDDSVDNGHGHIVIKEELAPIGERLAGSQDDRPVFIQRIDEPRRVVHALLVHRQIAQLVDDQAIELEQLADFLFQLAFELSQFQALDQTQCRVEADLVAGLDGFQADADGQIGLAEMDPENWTVA